MARMPRSRNNVSQRLSFYIHIPYCIKRCGYCDFNTYTPQELQGPDVSSVSQNYIDATLLEIQRAKSVVGDAIVPTIFFGGGTPSLMPAEDLGRVITEIARNFEIDPSVEITIEVNPDSVSSEFLEKMRGFGATRISMGMQSASPHVLSVLDRTHNPENVALSIDRARRSGYEHVSVDLIYGAPGESEADWRATVDHALALDIDHISAYALIVETGTRLAAKIKRGELQMPPEDETANKYLYIDSAAERAGFSWYELSNWAKPGGECRHNIAYWNGSEWWGVGPGAHSFYGSKRWWNVKHPQSYQLQLRGGESPEAASEELTDSDRDLEYLMLAIRMRSGLAKERLTSAQSAIVERFIESGHISDSKWRDGAAVLTAQGRLIADRIVREISL